MTAYSKGNVYTKQDYNRNVSPVPFNNTPFTPGGFFNDPQVGNTNKFTTIDVSSARAEQFSQELRLQSPSTARSTSTSAASTSPIGR